MKVVRYSSISNLIHNYSVRSTTIRISPARRRIKEGRNMWSRLGFRAVHCILFQTSLCCVATATRGEFSCFSSSRPFATGILWLTVYSTEVASPRTVNDSLVASPRSISPGFPEICKPETCTVRIRPSTLTYPGDVSDELVNVTATVIPYVYTYPNGSRYTTSSTYLQYGTDVATNETFIEPKTTPLTWEDFSTTLYE